ncbi:MAG: bifunctional 1-(5-phosphoribosyl)-5-((5-phosphoribosylamino)methylideneamino)imidazole-4-carboxamide isomerase/phosphoribosylanthranilate isomerase PriA [Actinomycetaceae bacterium]|nr:bifunctional 1-(5-phosphoribosyl)-5-((5-phosphoribosylamino)methylideneamino)imidazole-4-carboxamide isomerase/phosphoribosylanthranilate isomerase PriA [Actinomycetaceae bacterium]
MQKIQLLPAIDIVEGKAVRLRQGAAGSEKIYGEPIEIAAGFAAAGASWIHLVDLDAAFGRGSNHQLVVEIVKEVPAVKVEVSGGIRSQAAVEKMLNAGAARVNLGTAALENLDWAAEIIAEYGAKVAIGLDVRSEELATHGWEKAGGNLWEVLEVLEKAACPRYVVTDIKRDGMLQGVNTDLLRKVCAFTEKPVIASGGVSSIADIKELRKLAPLGIEGVIVGKALYAGSLDIASALKAAEG